MKVSDVMQKHVEFVTSDTKILDVARLIFGRRINGLPVCEGKKIIGFIADTDILSKFHPTMQEFAEDPLASADFESMEEKAREVLELTAKDIMSKVPITIHKDDPLMRADSTMRIKDVGRLPVVDDKGDLVGIISMGDIFKSLVGKSMPYLESEEYHDWIASHFDLAIGWESRIPAEIPSLVDLFKKNVVKKILDIGCGTGEHAIALAKNGFTVVGIENSPLLFKVAKLKWKELPKTLQSKVKFIQGDYIGSLKKIKDEYQAAMFMGNAMAHMPHSYGGILKGLNSILPKKNSLIVVQLLNFEKAIKTNNNLQSFTVKQSKLSPEWKHAYFWFFDPPQKKDDLLMLNAGILDFNGKMWSARGTNSVATVPFTRKKIQETFKGAEFKKIFIYGSKYGEPIFKGKLKPTQSDWLNVVAKR